MSGSAVTSTADETLQEPAARYVYGIVPAEASLAALEGVEGLGAAARLVVVGQLGALVEPVEEERALGRRRDLVAHSAVLNAMAAHGPVLPLRFGSVVRDEETVVEELLGPQEEHFAALLGELTGRVQLTLRARYVLDALLAEIVRSDPEIARLRESTVGVSEDASHYERIRLGELVAQAVDRHRAVDADQILDAVLPLAERHVVREASGMDALLDVAVLVTTDRLGELEEVAEQLAAAYDGRARLSLVGPTAAYDFVPEH